MRFRDLIRPPRDLSEAKFRQPLTMFHGTSSMFLRTILKQGVVPNPTKKRWDSDEQQIQQAFSRVSLPGSYWTSNLMTAISSATNTTKKFGGGDLVLIAQIAEQSAYADEDSIDTKLRFALSDTVRELHPQIRADAWFVFGHDVLDHEPALRARAQEVFVQKLHHHLAGDPRHVPDRRLADELLDVLVLRSLAFEAKNGMDLSRWMTQVPDVPPISEIEERLLALRERLTRSYRSTAFYSEDKFNHTLRITTPVGFSGANRIISIVELPKYRWETREDGKQAMMVDPLRLLYGRADLPAGFMEQYRSRVGEFPGLVDAKGTLVHPSERVPRWWDKREA